jgi:SNF2 family DNA or RNA helicase
MFTGKLYPYQQPVVKQFADRGSLLLAFTQGTGKTPTAIACAEYLFDEEYSTLCLVVCPASLKYQWEERIKQFTNSKVTVVDGDKDTRGNQYDTWHKSPYYLIISYDYVLLDEQVAHLNPDMVILDEASAIKSFKTQRSKKIKKLFKDVPYRLALTGTPIENKPEELYSIMQWVDSSVLGRYDLFEKAYVTRSPRGWVTAYKNLDVLKERIGGAMVRKSRTDPDVARYMPDVDNSNWIVPMDKKIARIYCVIAADMLSELETMDNFDTIRWNTSVNNYVHDDTPPGRLMAMHMVMEMLLCHPALISWSAKNYTDGKYEGSEYASLIDADYHLELLPVPKLDMLKYELEFILEGTDSKVLIYSKYKEMLNILEKELPYKSVQFTGDMSAKEKNEAVRLFTTSDTRLFLSSYAGGYGLDMAMADYLINYDHPWSFGTQDQINARHVRASSKFKTVFIRNLILHESIEERKMRVLDRKRTMSALAVDGANPGSFTGGNTVNLDTDFLRDHLTEFTERYR